MAEFKLPAMQDHELGWGPPPDAKVPGLQGFPLESIQKNDKIGRVCDFSASGLRNQQMRGGRRDMPPAEPDEDETFQLVDTRPTNMRGRGFGRGKGGRGGRG